MRGGLPYPTPPQGNSIHGFLGEGHTGGECIKFFVPFGGEGHKMTGAHEEETLPRKDTPDVLETGSLVTHNLQNTFESFV